MPQKYSPHERATLFVLLLAGREVANPELVNEHGITLTPAGRAKLNRAGLIRTNTDRRPYLHTITDGGVDWCAGQLLDIEVPPRSAPVVRAVFAIAQRLAKYQRANGISLADVFPADLPALIRTVYRQLAGKPQDFIRLAELRAGLDGAGKGEVDAALLAMSGTGRLHLAPESARLTITDADRKAAIRIGGEDNHLVAIEES
jgi:hypothetical protein